MFLTLIVLKPTLEPAVSNAQFQIRECFTKDIFSIEVLGLYLHDSYNHYQNCFIVISILKYKNYKKILSNVLNIFW